MTGRLFRNTRIAHKLLLISLSFALPIAVLLYFTVVGINKDIHFATLELHGNDFQRPLEDLLQATLLHQAAAQRALGGEAKQEGQLHNLQTRFDQALQKLDAVNRRYGLELQFTDEGLGKRQRTSSNQTALTAAWGKLKQDLKSLDPNGSNARHRHLRETIRTMLTHAGDTSNLVLDPDLDSYYLSVALATLPQSQDRLADVLVEGRTMLAKEELSSADQLRMSVLMTLIRESDLAAIGNSVRTALNEDSTFYGVSPSLRNLETPFDGYLNATEELLNLMSIIAESPAPKATPDDFERIVKSATDASFRLWTTGAQELDILLQIRNNAHSHRRLLALVLTLLALAISVALVIQVAKGITQPMATCVSGLQKLAAKDLTHRLDSSSHGEMGDIAGAINQAADGMREAIHSLCASAEELKQASENQTEASHQLSANAEETSAQAKIVSKAAEKVSKNAQAVAMAVDELSNSIREIASNAQDAARVATEAVQVAGSTNVTVTRLGQSSKEIGEVIKVITSIAEQTNLLALNATIEAARAGEAGKGFAVVANAVKELAKETAKATEDISRKIDGTQRDIHDAVDGIRRIGHIIEQINDFQNSIAGAVEEQTVVTRQISSNVADAARGSTEIAENIIAVAQAAAGTAEGAATTQQAAQKSASLAVRLQGLVGQFRS
ncbi:MAG: methyl-accepting chemotaxis protein [Planctomycetia bacterium]|nr:methyl-accepting chemotaxis protein [Planctomycetia bacterium]